MAASRRPWLIPALLVGAGVVAFVAFGVFGVQTLFIDEEVSEAAPVFTSTESSTDSSAGNDSANDSSDDGADSADGGSADNTDDTDNTNTDNADDSTEQPAAIEPITVADGSFADGAHPTTGTALILSDGGSQQALRLEDDFVTDNGPDLNVYLASSADGFGDEYIDLGDLKGNIGSQNYELPADVDLSVYDTVVIWCVRFGVGFGSAELGVA